MNKETDKNLKLKVWEEFCDSLKESGSIILNEKDIDELDMVEGWRYLTRLTRLGLEMALENNNPYFPSFYSLSHETAKIGADNPDNIYLNASIDGNCDYRIWGTRGTVHYLSFGTKSNKYDQDGTMVTTGELDSKDIKIENDGSFQILLSKNKKIGNWLSLKENTNMVIVRQTFLDRTQEEASDLNIECLSSPTSPEALNLKFVTQSLQKVSAFVEGTASTFVKWTNIFKQEITLKSDDSVLFPCYSICRFICIWDWFSGKVKRITIQVTNNFYNIMIDKFIITFNSSKKICH